MLVLLFVAGCFCVIAYLLGRASRLNRSIKRGDAIVDVKTGEVHEPGSRQYEYAKRYGKVKFK